MAISIWKICFPPVAESTSPKGGRNPHGWAYCRPCLRLQLNPKDGQVPIYIPSMYIYVPFLYHLYYSSPKPLQFTAHSIWRNPGRDPSRWGYHDLWTEPCHRWRRKPPHVLLSYTWTISHGTAKFIKIRTQMQKLSLWTFWDCPYQRVHNASQGSWYFPIRKTGQIQDL